MSPKERTRAPSPSSGADAALEYEEALERNRAPSPAEEKAFDYCACRIVSTPCHACQYRAMRTERDSLRAEVAKVEAERDEAKAAISRFVQDSYDIGQQARAMKALADKAETRVAELENELEAAKNAIDFDDGFKTIAGAIEAQLACAEDYQRVLLDRAEAAEALAQERLVQVQRYADTGGNALAKLAKAVGALEAIAFFQSGTPAHGDLCDEPPDDSCACNGAKARRALAAIREVGPPEAAARPMCPSCNVERTYRDDKGFVRCPNCGWPSP